jgi:hypothetical protein
LFVECILILCFCFAERRKVMRNCATATSPYRYSGICSAAMLTIAKFNILLIPL